MDKACGTVSWIPKNRKNIRFLGFFNTKKSRFWRSWEAIFSKSTFVISEMELNCCRRIVDLCKDCVLIVYKYALDQKSAMNVPISANTNVATSKLSSSVPNIDENPSSLLNRRKKQNLLKEQEWTRVSSFYSADQSKGEPRVICKITGSVWKK